MREIKFRAWAAGDNSEMLSGHRLDELLMRGYGTQQPNELQLMVTGNTVLMQYTGLKDKNGVDVYEGDLLGGAMNGFSIRWDATLSSFWPINEYMPEEKNDVYWQDIVDMANEGRLVVIGNIYENPELLEPSHD